MLLKRRRLMRYSNLYDIPLPLANWLASDDYDYEEDTISATTLIAPIRQTLLSLRIKEEDKVEDVSNLIASRLGSAIHNAIESSWLNKENSLKALGYSDKAIQRIKINPTELEKGDIPIYLEQRAYKEVEGITISGKYDFVEGGIVQDFKSTSVYTYINQTNASKYILQGSIYRWLNPSIITEDYMYIHYIFTDWSSASAKQRSDYPQRRIMTKRYDLMSIEETQKYVEERVRLIARLKDVDDRLLPLCTEEELWRKPTTYRYYRRQGLKKATKVFTDLTEARLYMQTTYKGEGYIETRQGSVTACKYCKVASICTQRDKLIETGELEND